MSKVKEKLMAMLEPGEEEISFKKEEVVALAAEIGDFLSQLAQAHPDRTVKLTELPFGNQEYSMALDHWYSKDRPDNCWFCYDEGQKECPWLMEFRKELTNKFGLPIYSREEVKIRDSLARRIPHPNGWNIN